MRMNPARLSLVGMVCAVLLLAACGGNTFSVGGTISGLSGTVVLQNNGTNNLSISANGAFTFPGYLTGGSAYNVTVLTQPAGQACTVSAGSGTVNSTVNSVVVTCSNTSLPRFAYVANSGSNTISQYTIGTGGALTAMATATVPAGSAPNSIAVFRSATTTYVYVANSGSNDIWQYAIGKDVGKEGALTKISTTSPVAGSAPSSITINTVVSGTYAYVINSGSDNVYQYAIGNGGVLDETSRKTVPAGKNSRSITIHPSGKYAYVANSGSGDISQYSIGDDGALAPTSSMSLPVGSAPSSITIATTPSGTYYAYVANSGSTSISQYAIVGGSLQPIPLPTPPTVDVGATPYSVTVEPLGKYAYVVNSDNGGSVSQYTIQADGSLKAMTTATVSAGTTPRSIAVDPSGQYVYTANYGSDNISQYTIGTGSSSTSISGALTPIAAAVVADSKPIFVISVK